MLLKALSLQDTKRTVLEEDFIGYFCSWVIYYLQARLTWESCPEGSWEPMGGVKVNFRARAGVLTGLCHRVVVWVTCPDLSSQDKRCGALSNEELDARLASRHPALAYSSTASHTPPSPKHLCVPSPNAWSSDTLETVAALEKVPGSGEG